MKKLLLTAIFSTMVCAVNAVTYTVPGWADPWLANGGIDPAYAGEPADYPYAKPDNTPYPTPDSSPIYFGSVSAGDTLSWIASGSVGHPGDAAGPDGASYYPTTHANGAINGIPDISAPINALIGVFTGPSSFASIFIMGSSGSITVPAGATDFYMGTMDGYGWGNNIGAFRVDFGVPDGGATIALLGGVMVILGGITRRFRR